MGKIQSILDIPGCVMEIGGEAIPQCGEDAFGSYLCENGCAMAVFDGCGGSGSEKLASFGSKTGAYVASRKCRDTFFHHIKKFFSLDEIIDEEIVLNMSSTLKKQFFRVLNNCSNFAQNSVSAGQNIRGSIVRPFPTTMSSILCDYYEEKFSVGFIWAGNSRGFFLDENGLAQVTQDHIMGQGDAMENLKNDAPLTNLISADWNFSLSSLYFVSKLPTVLISATDGSFDCFPSPMHFEYTLLMTMADSSSYEEWQKRMDDILSRCASDDYSLVIGCFGFNDFDTLKLHFCQRLKSVYRTYIYPLSEDPTSVNYLWSQYKQNYYRSAL